MTCGAAARAQDAADPRSVVTLPVQTWQVESEPGDKVTLVERQGCLQIDYDVDIKAVRQSGHETFKETSFRILLKDARPLGEGEERVLFEARGMDGNVASHASGATILPIILDEKGESLFYKPFLYPHLKNASKNWARWMSSYVYSSEAGGATHSVFGARGGDGNNWPDGRLRFAGFEVRVRRAEFGRERGTLQIDSVQTAGLRLAPGDPFAYADSLLKEDGDYILSVQVRDRFQGPPIREFASEIRYRGNDLQSRRQRVTFPLGAAGNYWINYQIADRRTGQAVAGERLRYEQAQSSPATPPADAVDLTAPPVMGVMRVNPDQHMDGVYERGGDAATVKVRLFPKDANEITLTWRLRPFAYDTTFAEATQTVRFDGQRFVDVDLTVPWQKDHDAYRLDLGVQRGGKAVDEQQYVLGRRTDLAQPRTTRRGKLVDRDQIKQSAYFHVTYTESQRPRSEDDALADFEAFVDQASQVSRRLTYMVALEEFLVLPGVYDMALLDRLMDAAADRGCTLKIRFGVHYEPGKGDGFTYLKYGRQTNVDGAPILQHIYGGGFSLTDANYVAGWMDAFKAVHARYQVHPAFEGYYVMQPCGENTVFDKPWEGQIAGYEASTEPAFRAYLRNTLKLSLDQLNARWGSAYTDWDQVAVPLPDLRLGTRPDLRRQWLDFNLFKVQLGEWWFHYAASRIREYDKRHLLVTYGGSGDARPEALAEWVDYFHNGGNHFLQGEGGLVKAWEKKIGWITEPHHPHFWAAYGDPRDDRTTVGAGWILDWSVYVAFAQAGGGGANLHVYYAPTLPKPLPAHYGGIAAYDRLEKFKPILRELHGATLLEAPRQVATLQDPYTLYCKHRTTFAPRLEDLRRWHELVKLDSVAAEQLREDHLAQYKLLVPNLLDEVMSRHNIETLRKTVEGGARMLISAKTGSYCPDLGTEPFQLLRTLGIQSPSGAYVTDEAGVNAEVVEENALFDRGRKVRFYSQADMRRDLADPVVQKAFWAWPYRWLPQSDYFGYYRDNRQTNGKVLARFASGAVAMSLHPVGKGEVVVFWGTPDFRPEALGGLMSRAADWAGVENPRRGSPIPHLLEARNADLGRYYALTYQIHPGSYRLKLPQTPDGKWFVDDMVDGFKFGVYTGTELREQGIELGFVKGASPMKILRLLPDESLKAPWNDFYRLPKAAGQELSDMPDATPVPAAVVPSFDRFDAKARAGEKLNVVFLGGSLTWGANASDPQATSYRALVADRLRRQYPQARFRFHDAAIGGTGSQLAVFRLDRDVLAHKPDLVFLDFSANDDIYSKSAETSASYEAIVRRLVSEARCPVLQVILPFKWNIKPGENEAMPRRDAHVAIGRAYGTAVVDVIAKVNDLTRAGLAHPDELWADPNDGAHPMDPGYALFAETIWEGFLQAVRDRQACAAPEKMLFADTYTQSVRFPLSRSGALPAGWAISRPNRTSAYFDMLMSRWLDDEVVASARPGGRVERLRVRFRGTMVMLFGEGTPRSGKYRAYIDGRLVEQDVDGRPVTEIDAGRIAIPSNGNTHHVSILAERLDADVEHVLEIEPLFAAGAEQELRLESVCVAGPGAHVAPADPVAYGNNP